MDVRGGVMLLREQPDFWEHQVGGKWPVLTDKQTYRAKWHERERSHIALVPTAAEAEVPLTVSAEPGWFGR